VAIAGNYPPSPPHLSFFFPFEKEFHLSGRPYSRGMALSPATLPASRQWIWQKLRSTLFFSSAERRTDVIHGLVARPRTFSVFPFSVYKEAFFAMAAKQTFVPRTPLFFQWACGSSISFPLSLSGYCRLHAAIYLRETKRREPSAGDIHEGIRTKRPFHVFCSFFLPLPSCNQQKLLLLSLPLPSPFGKKE